MRRNSIAMLRKVFSRRTGRLGKSSTIKGRSGARHRRLLCEPLEDRRLLSVFSVTNLSDSGAGSLRQAVANANSNAGADTITFASSLAGKTIALTSGQLNLADTTGKTTIDASSLTSNIIVSGNNALRVFYINSGVAADISDLTITQGNVSGSNQGGGIYNAGVLTISNCTVTQNAVGSPNTSSGCGGGIYNTGTLTITGGTISDNTSSGWGGGIGMGGSLTITDTVVSGNTSYWSGGGIESGGALTYLTINDCTIANNVAQHGNGGGMENESTTTISRSTFSGNSAPNSSYYGHGGGINNISGGRLTITNSTIAGNSGGSSGSGGGIWDDNGLSNEHYTTLTLTNVTVAANSGGGIYEDDTPDQTGVRSTATLCNTVVGGNTDYDIHGSVTAKYSLIESTSGTTFNSSSTNNVTGKDPKLGTLGPNGGSTSTIPLLAGSPAIDAGSNALIPSGVTIDQCGHSRIVHGIVDIGAYEYWQPAEIHGTKWNDLNGNGVWDAGEPALAGWTIYLDTNHNGQLDAGEPSTVTDAQGNYAFTNLIPGQYTVAEVVQPGWRATSPELLYFFHNPTPAANDGFGSAVTAVGNNVLVGASSDDTAGTDAGAAYLMDGTTGSVLQTFLGEAAGDNFGCSASADGDNLLIGAVDADGGVGAAYLYDASTGALRQKFQNPTPNPNEMFGCAVAIKGNYVLIGAQWDDPGGMATCGAVYLYDATTGQLLHTFQPNPLGSRQYFGMSLAFVGDDKVLIGAQCDATQGFDHGAAYLFDLAGNELYKFFAPPSETYWYFGRSVATAGNNLVICSYDNTYVYDGTTYSLLRTISGGGSVAAVGTSEFALCRIGGTTVQLYDGTTGNLLHTYTNPTPAFGTVADFGGDVLVGASGDGTDGTNAGAAYLFRGDLASHVCLRSGIYNLSLTNGQVATGEDFGNQQLGEIHGTKWNDLNGNGVWDAGEPALAGWTIYLDTNHNGQLDAGEPSTVTDAQGNYAFTNLIPGQYTVAEVVQPGWRATSPELLYFFHNPTPAANDGFGSAVTAVGNNVLVGASSDDTAGTDAGAAYLMDGTTGSVLQTFLGEAAGDNFGCSASADGDNLLIGAVDADGGVGAAYLYDASTGALRQKFQNPTPNPNEMFGCAVAIKGNYVLIGAQWDDPGGMATCGAVYLYDATTGQLLHTFQPNPLGSRQYFGMSLAFVGDDKVLIGAQCDATQGFDHGAAYLFDLAGNELYKFFAPPSETYWYFGRSVATAGNNLLVASYLYTYLFDGTTGQLLHTFPFGGQVTVVGNDVAICPPGNTGDTTLRLYDGQSYDLLKSFPNPTNDFANPAALGDDVLVGAPGEDTDGPDAGAAYLFRGAGVSTRSGIYDLTLVSGQVATGMDFGNQPLLIDTTPPTTYNAIEGNTTGSQVVATFTDAMPGATPAGFSGTIDWGDGTASTSFTGTDVTLDAGTFSVHGSHVDAEEGTYHVTVIINDPYGQSVTATHTTFAVADALLTGSTAATAGGTEGATLSSVLSGATFTDANPGNHSGDFTATITWGDSSTSPGTVSYSGGTYTVSGSHTYADEGSYPISITVVDAGGQTATITGTATVADAPLTDTTLATTFNVIACKSTEDQVLATFNDGNPNAPLSDFTATVDWGGAIIRTPSSPTAYVQLVSRTATLSTWHVLGSAIYAAAGTYPISVEVRDVDSKLTSSGKIHFAASAAVLTDTTPKKTYNALEGNSTKTQILATFTDTNAKAQPANFTPTVTWNGTLDGTPTVSVKLVSHTKTLSKWEVVGSATYADVGTYAATVFVQDTAGNVLLSSGKTQFKVADAPLHDATRAKTYNTLEGNSTGIQVLATFTDGNPYASLSAFSGTIDWGDGKKTPFTSTDVTLASGVFSVHGGHTYAEEGKYSVSVSVKDVDGSSLTSKKVKFNVVDVPLTDATVATTYPATMGKSTGSPVLATFVDANPLALASDFKPTVNWGGTLVGKASVSVQAVSHSATTSTWNVMGSATYSKAGTYTVKVTIADVGGKSVSTNKTTFKVTAPASPGSVLATAAVFGGAASPVRPSGPPAPAVNDAALAAVLGEWTASSRSSPTDDALKDASKRLAELLANYL